MAHYRKLFPPTEFLGPQDFTEPREVTISRVAVAEMPEREGKKERAACMWIRDLAGVEYPRRLKLAKLNLTAISYLLGQDYDQWAGKKITLKGAWCLSFGDIEECVRVVLDETLTKRLMSLLKKRKTSPRVWECAPPQGVNNAN